MFLFACDYLHRTYALPVEWYFVAIVFSLLVSLSRLYFGVHSVVDIIGGYVLGFAQLFFTWLFGAATIVDNLLVRTHGSSLILLLFASTSVLVALYPYDR
jgi:PAP2 superfamily